MENDDSENCQDWSAEEWLAAKARPKAAAVYRSHGHNEFADRIERKLEDDCQIMRVMKLFDGCEIINEAALYGPHPIRPA